jgi:signal transduction histidine kinase
VHIAAVLRDNGKFVEFSVEDSGLGISPTEQEKIFQPFTQLDSTYAKKPEGTGLGLSLCRKIVELHGGNIRVRSETGNGSFFYFTIPRLTRA